MPAIRSGQERRTRSDHCPSSAPTAGGAPSGRCPAVPVSVLGEIDGMREALRHHMRAAPAKWTAGLRKFLTADAVAASNSVEGFKVSTVDVENQ